MDTCQALYTLNLVDIKKTTEKPLLLLSVSEWKKQNKKKIYKSQKPSCHATSPLLLKVMKIVPCESVRID